MVFRPTYHSPIPADAKRFTKGGKQYAKFRLARSGELVTGEVLPSGKARIQSPIWYARIRKNGQSVRESTGVTDKLAAEQIAAKLQLDAHHQRAGIIDEFAAHRNTPLTRHLQDYQEHLESKGCTPKHVRENVARIARALKECKFEYPEEFRQVWLDRWLNSLVKQGSSYRTRNLYLKSLRSLVNWMVKSKRLPSDPFTLSTLLPESQCTHRRPRRALTPDELGRLIAAAEKDQGTCRGIGGRQRALIYLTSAVTGLRRKELALLRIKDLSLDGEYPYLIPSHEKVARGEAVAVHPTLAAKLREWMALRTSPYVFDLLSGNGQPKQTADLMKRDCRLAGIPYTTAEGTADFHSHRSAFITNLCRTGTDFSLIVSMARHSTPRLTSIIYDKVRLEDKHTAISLLPIGQK